MIEMVAAQTQVQLEVSSTMDQSDNHVHSISLVIEERDIAEFVLGSNCDHQIGIE